MEIVLAFLFGLLIGSFINVLLFRFRTGKGFWGRSYCARCSTTLRWYDLVPLLSYVVLRGRCRFCGVRLSLQYPLVELAHGVLYALVALYFGITGASLLLFPIMSILLFVAVYDLRHTIIPDGYAYALAALSFLYLFLSVPEALLGVSVVAGFLMPVPFLLFFLISRGRWMGLGDAKLALGCGLLVASVSPFAPVAAVLIAFWTGAIISILFIALLAVLRRLKPARFTHTMSHEVPFAPYLILGTLLVLFFDIGITDLLQWLTF